MPHWRLLLLIVALNAPAVHAGTNAPLRSTTSVTGQFTAFAPGPVWPAALCAFAEHLKRHWRDSLAAPDNWHDPIVFVLRDEVATNAADSVTLRLVQIGPVVKYEIDCRLTPPPDEPTLATTVIEALCLEVANRDRPANAAVAWRSAQIPVWLIYGLAGTMADNNEWQVSVARRSATAARPPTARDLLSVAAVPPDEVDRALFLANAWLLTDSLLRLPGGTRKLQQFLTELRPAGNAATAFTNTYRVEFPDEVALEKWWSLAQARLATVVVPQDLTASATAQRLDTLLVLGNGVPFRELYRHSDEAWFKRDLPGRVNELEVLSSRAHPLYRPVLAAYAEAGYELVNGNISRFRRAVARAEKLRPAADQQAQAIADFLDQAEATYTPSSSNLWRGYFQTIEKLENFEHNRHSPIGDYLDKFDK